VERPHSPADADLTVSVDSTSPDSGPCADQLTLLRRIQNKSRQFISRYFTQGEIGRGGMGTVLLVRDVDLSRDLAMKIMNAGSEASADLASDETSVPLPLARFLEEAQVTAQLDHPGIVPVHDVGIDEDGRIFFTMRLVRGRELGVILRLARANDEGWNLSRAVGVLVKACHAVAYAHSKGVIHRDLKPRNIMVGVLIAATSTSCTSATLPPQRPRWSGRRPAPSHIRRGSPRLRERSSALPSTCPQSRPKVSCI
jgi:hypothetical protein